MELIVMNKYMNKVIIIDLTLSNIYKNHKFKHPIYIYNQFLLLTA